MSNKDPTRNVQTMFPPCAVLFLSSLSFAGVLRVAPSGAPYTTPQAAIDAAVDGDTILIAPGFYPGFTINNEALAIAVDPAGNVDCGAVLVENLASTKNVLIDSLRLTAAGGTALKIRACSGSVRIQGCTLFGANAVYPTSMVSAQGAYITGSTDVVLRSCTINGGNGYSDWSAGNGADGIFIRGSKLASYHCTVRGGWGGTADPDSHNWGGNGGDGLETPDSFVLVQQNSFTGGTGGAGGDGDFLQPGGNGGAGGHGLRLQAEATSNPPRAVNRQSTLLGGNGGVGGFWGGAWGANGSPAYVAVGSVTTPAQTDCLRVSTPTSWPAGTIIPITIDAPPGTSVSLYVALDTGFAHNAFTDYALHIPAPFLRRLSQILVPPSGTITLNVNAPGLPLGIPTLPWYVQAVVTPIGAAPTSSLACAVVF